VEIRSSKNSRNARQVKGFTMPFNGSGQFELSQDFRNDRDLGRPDSLIDADKVMAELENIAKGISSTLALNGTTTPTADISWGGKKIKDLKPGQYAGDAVTLDQISGGQFDWVGQYGGTATALTATLPFTPDPITTGVRVKGLATLNNTGPITIALNGSAPKVAKRLDGEDLKANDLKIDRVYEFILIGNEYRLVTPLTADGRGKPFFSLKPGLIDASLTSYSTESVDETFSTLSDRTSYVWPCPGNNGGVATLNISNSGAKPIVRMDGSAIPANALEDGNVYILHYISNQYRVIGASNALALLPVIPSLDLTDINDVDDTGAVDDDVLTFNANVWKARAQVPVPAKHTALTVVSGHRAIKLVAAGKVEHCSNTSAQVFACIGVSSNSAAAGGVVSVIKDGPLVDPSWTWTVGGNIFVTAGGVLSQTLPTATGTYVLIVGVATATDEMCVKLQPPILLA
jgi:hypothetical protein